MKAAMALQVAQYSQLSLMATVPFTLAAAPITIMAAHGTAAVVTITSTALARMDTMAT